MKLENAQKAKSLKGEEQGSKGSKAKRLRGEVVLEMAKNAVGRSDGRN